MSGMNPKQTSCITTTLFVGTANCNARYVVQHMYLLNKALR